MANLIKTKMMGLDKFNSTVVGVPENGESTFDSTLERSVDSGKNWILRITLRMFFRQVNPNQLTAPMMQAIANSLGLPVPAGVPVGMNPDSNNQPHFTKEWSSAEWARFMAAVQSQASLWNGKYWLMPPDDFEHFDMTEGSWTAKSGSLRYRPNVKCEFRLVVVPGHAHAHASVDAVNLLSPTGFRSHSGLYNSADETPVSHVVKDLNAATVRTNHPIIAHELGHSLGLPHIGVTRNIAHCKLALVMGRNFQAETIPALYKGGSNSDVCYGDLATAGDIHDIMGAGDKFGIENAKPWLDRLFAHLNLNMNEAAKVMAGIGRWKVSSSEVPPMSLVGFK